MSAEFLNFLRCSCTDYLVKLFNLLNDPVYYGLGIARGHSEPILLVPGFLEADCSMIPMGVWLARIGYRPHLSGIGLNIGCPRGEMERLAERIDMIVRDDGFPLTIVGHSLGGMIGRGLAAMRPGSVRNVITLGSPTRFELDVIRQELRPVVAEFQGLWRAFADPAHEWLRDLLTVCSATNCDISSIFSRDDDVVDWRACLVPARDNYEISGKHCSLIVNAEVYRIIAKILANSAHVAGCARPIGCQLPQYIHGASAGAPA